MFILFGLILRGVSVEFRGKVESPGWKKVWDTGTFLGCFIPALLLGVAFANIFRGIPIDGQGVYKGTLFTLLNPYGLLGGVFFLTFFIQHGAIWLAVRSEGSIHESAARTARGMWPVLLILAVAFLAASAGATRLYENYLSQPVLFLVILLAVAALLGVRIFLAKESYWKAWFSSAVFCIGATFFGIIGLYPSMLPSSLDASFGITIRSASSPLTLTIMLVLALIFVPVVLLYQGWAYRLFRHKVTEADLAHEESY